MKILPVISILLFSLHINSTDILLAQSKLTEFYDSDSIFVFDINNITLPIDNKGTIADIIYYDSLGNLVSSAQFEESTFLFTAGFGLSGFSKGKLWASGVMTANRIEDFLPGNIGNELNDSLKKFTF